MSLSFLVSNIKVEEALRECHLASTGRYFGVRRTLAKVQQRFFWLDHRVDVEEWCHRCYACTSRKGPKEKGREPFKIYNVMASFEKVAIDIIEPLPKSSNGKNMRW